MIETLEQAIVAIEELQREALATTNKLDNLEELTEEQTREVQEMIAKSEKAQEIAMNAFRVDHYGYVWRWDTGLKQYVKTDSRICTPIIADEAVKERHIAPEAITENKIAADAIKERHIADRQVKERHIADRQILERHIADKQIKERHVADGAITSDKISGTDDPDGPAITGSHIADNAVQSRHIEPNAVISQHIHKDAVTNEKIHDGAVDSDALAPNSVTEGKIQDGSVTSEKIAEGYYNELGEWVSAPAVTADKISGVNDPEGPAVTEEKIATAAVTMDKLSGSKDPVTGEWTTPPAVGNEQLAPGSVSSDKLAPGLIQDLQEIVDPEPTAGSVKPVQSGGVYNVTLGALIRNDEMDEVLEGGVAVYLTDANNNAVLDDDGKPIEII